MSDYRDVAMASVELAVTIGIIEAALDQGAPDDVKENFVEKVDALVEHLHSEVIEFQQFGEAYDDEAS